VVTYRDIATAQLQVDEGRKAKLYNDSLGIPSIGIGRNLRDVGLRPDEIDYLFQNDLNAAEAIAKALVPSFEHLSDNRKAVILNIAFNMGNRLAEFVKFRKAVQEENFDAAATELASSRWSIQVGVRATRLAKQMRDG
jgi:lysozyme